MKYSYGWQQQHRQQQHRQQQQHGRQQQQQHLKSLRSKLMLLYEGAYGLQQQQQQGLQQQHPQPHERFCRICVSFEDAEISVNVSITAVVSFKIGRSSIVVVDSEVVEGDVTVNSVVARFPVTSFSSIDINPTCPIGEACKR